MYVLMNNRKASKFDLYLSEHRVATLHYAIDENERMFIYCEAVEPDDAISHCTELMSRVLDEVADDSVKTIVICPIAVKFLKRAVTVARDQAIETVRS